MGSLDVFSTRIETMSLADSNATVRTVAQRDRITLWSARFRVARWVDWFRLATCVLIGELMLPAGKICSFRILAGHGHAIGWNIQSIWQSGWRAGSRISRSPILVV